MLLDLNTNVTARALIKACGRPPEEHIVQLLLDMWYGAHQYEEFINWTVTCRNRRLIRQYSELDVYSVILKLLIVTIEPLN
jgi:hypothetical protein